MPFYELFPGLSRDYAWGLVDACSVLGKRLWDGFGTLNRSFSGNRGDGVGDDWEPWGLPLSCSLMVVDSACWPEFSVRKYGCEGQGSYCSSMREALFFQSVTIAMIRAFRPPRARHHRALKTLGLDVGVTSLA